MKRLEISRVTGIDYRALSTLNLSADELVVLAVTIEERRPLGFEQEFNAPRRLDALREHRSIIRFRLREGLSNEQEEAETLAGLDSDEAVLIEFMRPLPEAWEGLAFVEDMDLTCNVCGGTWRRRASTPPRRCALCASTRWDRAVVAAG